jgi:hypothetical protein
MRALRERAERAETARREAEERAAHPRLDEATLMSALGEETAEILRSARNAAAEVLAKAEAAAERVGAEAQAKADELVSRAESLLAERTSEAERAAAQVLEQAREEAQKVLASAAEQAAAQTDEAERRSEELVKSAQATRERVLGELARRRRLATVQIEQLRAGRERLLAAYLTVRRTLDEVTEELQRADSEARAAAGAVGRQHSGEVHELAGDHAEDVWCSLGAPEPAQVPPVVLAPKAGDVAAPERASEHASTGVSASWAAASDDRSGGVVAAAAEFESVRILRPTSEAHEPVTAAHEPVTAAHEPVTQPGEPPSEPGEPPGEPGEPPGEPGEPPGERQDSDARGTDEPRPAGEADVDDLFARIKAGRAEAKSRAKRALEATNGRRTEGPPGHETSGSQGGGEQGAGVAGGSPRVGGVGELQAGEHAGGAQAGEHAGGAQAGEHGWADRTEPSNETAPRAAARAQPAVDVPHDGEAAAPPAPLFMAERDQLTARLETSLARKLKRALQDEQNALLDRLRSLKGSPERILPNAEEQPDRFAEAGRPLLEEAARGGIQLVKKAFGAPHTAQLGSDVVEDLADELGRAIAEPLRQRLEEALRSGGEGAELADALGAAYREWKTQRLEEAAHDQVAAAFARGAYLALPDGAPLQWVVDTAEGPCPDCEDNALARDLAKGEPWPTGQLHPPAHPGCRCALVPAVDDPMGASAPA